LDARPAIISEQHHYKQIYKGSNVPPGLQSQGFEVLYRCACCKATVHWPGALPEPACWHGVDAGEECIFLCILRALVGTE